MLLHFIGEVGSPHFPSPTSVYSVFLYTGWGPGRGGGLGRGPGRSGGWVDFCGDCHYASAISNCFWSCDVTYVARYSTEPEPVQTGIHVSLKQWLTDVGLRTPPLLRSPTPTSSLLNVQLGVFFSPFLPNLTLCACSPYNIPLRFHAVPTIYPYALCSY